MKTKFLLTIMFCAAVSFAIAQSDVLSSKQNIPVKKESFSSKLGRYKSEGFKVAVLLVSGPITTKTQPPSSTTSLLTNITLKGELPSMASDLAPLAESFAGTMNEAFATDVFEIVDASIIPSKEGKFGKVYDWGSTKYKMVVSYAASPMYDYTLSNGKYEAALTVNLNVTATEFVNENLDFSNQKDMKVILILGSKVLMSFIHQLIHQWEQIFLPNYKSNKMKTWINL
jgi:hypothetical protein